MKYYLLIASFILVLAGCAYPKKEVPTEIRSAPFEITDVSVSPKRFNPTLGEAVTISYSLSRQSKVIINVYDPEMKFVRDLLGNPEGEVGLNRIIWDGKDNFENIVPDEAYFFTIQALDYQQNFAFYDPITFSGDENLTLEEINFDKEKKRVSYSLPKDTRIRIRAGITGGPLLKTIVNWQPRLSGYNEEPWEGKDESGLINALKQKDYSLKANIITLPENSIITIGNNENGYYEYAHTIDPDRPKKEYRPFTKEKRTWMDEPFFKETASFGLEPRFKLDIPSTIGKTENGVPQVAGKVPVKLSLHPDVKKVITEQRYEMLFFVDFKFFTEEEEGYSPYTWMWNTKLVTNGEHILTVNVCTLAGQVSSSSVKVDVKN